MVASGKKNLVIVESPGKIKTIAKVLGKDYVVKASIGHVRDLPTTKKQDVSGSLVIGIGQDFTPSYVDLPAKKKVLDDLKKAVKQVTAIYLCPDPDREGEAIAWHLAEALKLDDGRTFRVTFDEITPRGIRQGFAQPRKIDMDLVNAQQARRVLDRIVGYKLSPLLSAKMGGWLTAGRVQSVALRVIVDREREIEAFKAEEYWTLGARFEFAGRGFDAELRALDGRQVVASADDLAKYKTQDQRLGSSGVLRIRLGTALEAAAVSAALQTAAYEVASFDVKEVQDRPYPPFATSQLQQAAANRLGFNARRTMNVAQGLYQGVALGAEGPVALITYMRTDSFRIAPDALTECRDLIGKRYGAEYVPEKPNFYSSRKGAQDAHECIRPTHVELAPEDVRKHLSEEQYKLYKLIWERFVASQMPPAIFDATTCDLAARGAGARNAVFRATGRVLKFPGWLAVYGKSAAALESSAHLDASAADREKGNESGEGEGDEPAAPEAEAPAKAEAAKGPAGRKAPQVLPAMKVGDKPALKGLSPDQHYTLPAPRYSEASLVKFLENEGIGRPSTYAQIVSTLEDRGYVEKVTLGLQGPRDLAGRRVRSGSAEGEVLRTGNSTLVLRCAGGFECTVPRGVNLAVEENGAFAPLTQARLATGRGVFIPTALGMAVNDRLVNHFDHSIMDLGFTRRMETELDKIEEAHLNWRKVLEEFYAPFSRDLQAATRGMVSTKNKGEPTETKCPACGTFMEKRFNRYGYYLRCLKAPECKTTLRLDAQGRIQEKEKPQPTGLKCDLCGGDVVRSVGRFGAYLHCVRYPAKECLFTMKLNKEGHPLRKFKPLPSGLACEKCKSALVVRVTSRGKNRRPFLSCSNFPKCRAAKDLPPELKAQGEVAMAQWRENDARNQRDWVTYQAATGASAQA